MARWGHTMDASIGISPLWGIPNKHIEQMRFAHSSCAGRYTAPDTSQPTMSAFDPSRTLDQ